MVKLILSWVMTVSCVIHRYRTSIHTNTCSKLSNVWAFSKTLSYTIQACNLSVLCPIAAAPNGVSVCECVSTKVTAIFQPEKVLLGQREARGSRQATNRLQLGRFSRSSPLAYHREPPPTESLSPHLWPATHWILIASTCATIQKPGAQFAFGFENMNTVPNNSLQKLVL